MSENMETNPTNQKHKTSNKTKVFKIVLTLSLFTNAVLIGKHYFYDVYAYPSDRDTAILGEMTSKVINSDDYKKIAKEEKVVAITPYSGRLYVNTFPYYYGVRVDTKKRAHFFSCSNDKCSSVGEDGTSYSDYQDKTPLLPFKNK